MSLTNYRRGSDKERRIVNSFKAKGWIALRSAGSHSPIDCVAIDPASKTIKLIQAKMGYLSKPEAQKILDDIKKLNGVYRVQAELWHEQEVKA